MGIPYREVFLDGVHIKVFSKKKSFDVDIAIDPKTFLWKKRESRLCKVVFHTEECNKILDKGVVFKLYDLPYNRKKLSQVYNVNRELPFGGSITVTLKPAFFLPKNLREQYWKERDSIFTTEELNQKRTKNFVGICTGPSGKPGGGKRGRITHYNVNNAGNPYQGGKCSPK